MFRPPRCPHEDCSQHARPAVRFFIKKGSYTVRCRRRRIPRFLCRTCGRGFSSQTFRPDFRDHRPEVNARVRRLIEAGAGLRETARRVGLSQDCTARKIRKLSLVPAWTRRT